MTTHQHTQQRTRAARQTIRAAQLLGIDFAPLPTRPTQHQHQKPHHTHAPDPSDAPQPLPFTAPPTLPDTQVEAKPTAPPTAHTDPNDALEQLRNRYEQDPHTAATLIQGWNNIVFSDGDPARSQLMFIGEAPGADEDAQGLPFVGRAGQKLNEMINAMGLSRDTVFIANVLKVRPPNNRDPSETETAADGPYLLDQIAIVKPKVIVTLGRPASQFILGSKEPMGRLRANVHHPTNPALAATPVVPTYHPAYLLRAYTPDNRRKVWSDLQLAMSILNNDS